MQRIAHRRSDREDTVVVGELTLDALEVRWVKECVDRQADDLCTRCPAREPDGRRVGEDHSFTIMNEDAIRRQLYELFEALFGTSGVTPIGV
jgi:hypothetical protein